jgi:hypothetical protein
MVPDSLRSSQAHDPALLRKRLCELVHGVDPDDEPAVRALRRPLVAEILLWEFGRSFREHPEFSPMLDSIESAFESDLAMPGRFADLLRVLRS